MPYEILPHAIYSRDELKRIGFASIELLRAHGLTGGPAGGYLGSNVLEAIEAYIRAKQESKRSRPRRSAGGELHHPAAAIPTRQPKSKSQAEQFRERTGTR